MMAEKIKNFIQKKKLDIKFSGTGPGHRLDEESHKPQQQTRHVPNVTRASQSEASAVAGVAALNRLHIQQDTGGEGKSRVKNKPLVKDSVESKSTPTDMQTCFEPTLIRPLMCPSVYMICFVCKKSFPGEEILAHTETCLLKDYDIEPLSSSVHMIHTLCTDKDKKSLCVETLVRYIDNIIANPTEEKYRKIRENNKTFQEKVACVTGAVLFLKAIGFVEETLPFQDDMAKFYVLKEDKAVQTDILSSYKELLLSTTTLQPLLDRRPQLFEIKGDINHFDLPDSFYNMSIEEIKREQKTRTQALEKESILRTKAMREKDEIKSVVKYYKYVLIRVRFPEGVLLQGVFYPLDRLSEVRQLVVNQLIDPTRLFNLNFLHKPLNDDLATLAQLELAPAAVLNLSWVDGVESNGHYDRVLKPEIVQKS